MTAEGYNTDVVLGAPLELASASAKIAGRKTIQRHGHQWSSSRQPYWGISLVHEEHGEEAAAACPATANPPA